MKISKEFIENYTGLRVKLTMVDGSIFEGLLWFVEYEDESEDNVYSIQLDSYNFSFKSEHIIKIETLEPFSATE